MNTQQEAKTDVAYFKRSWLTLLRDVGEASKLILIEAILNWQFYGKEPFYLPNNKTRKIYEQMKNDLENININQI